MRTGAPTRFSVPTSEHVCASASTLPTLHSSHLVPVPTSTSGWLLLSWTSLQEHRHRNRLQCAIAPSNSAFNHARFPSLTTSKGFPRIGVRWKTWLVRRDRATALIVFISLTTCRFSLSSWIAGLRAIGRGDVLLLIYSRTPLNPYPFGGLLGYWLEELRLKTDFWRYGLRGV
jgi:hypothetical protein